MKFLPQRSKGERYVTHCSQKHRKVKEGVEKCSKKDSI